MNFIEQQIAIALVGLSLGGLYGFYKYMKRKN